MRELTQSVAADVMVFMTDSADHVTGKAGLTLTITASKAGGAFASITPTVTERGNGWYSLALTTTHTNTLGDLALHITSSGADPTDLVCHIVAVNKADSVRMGLTSLPNAAAQTSGGLITFGSGSGQLYVADGIANVNVIQVYDLETAADGLSRAFNYYMENTFTLPPVASVTDITNIAAAITSAESALLTAINALNQSASRRIVLQVITQMERPESGSTNFEIELRTYDADGAAVNADSTPTITPTGLTSGSLAANLSAVSNPSTGVYRATYNAESTDTLEQIRFVASATIATDTFTMTAYSLVCDFVAATWTTADRALLQTASDNSTAILADTNELQLDWVNGGRLDLILDAAAASASTASTAAQNANTNTNTIITNLAVVDQVADDIKAVTVKMDTMLVADDANWQFTQAAGELFVVGVTLDSGDITLIVNGVVAGLAGTEINYTGPVLEDGSIELVEGDDYTSRPFTWTITGYTGPSLSGAAAVLRFIPMADYNLSGNTATAEVSKSFTLTQSGTTVTASVAPTASDLTALTKTHPPLPSPNYKVQVKATSSNVTLVLANATRRRLIGPTA